MIKTLRQIGKQDKERFVVPKGVQDVIPITAIYDDGIFRVGKDKFTKTFKFTDINYAVASRADKEELFLEYSELLNSFDSGATTKITINNRRLNRLDFEKSILIPLTGDYLDVYRAEYNKMLLDKATGANSMVQDKYITVSVCKKNIEDARTYFNRVGKAAIKTSKQAAKAAQKTAKATAKAAQKAAKAAQQAAKLAAKAAKAAIQLLIKIIKAIIAALQKLISAIIAGGWVSVVVILIICMIALICWSVYGLFASANANEGEYTMHNIITRINNEYNEKITEIKTDNPHDKLVMSGSKAEWKGVLREGESEVSLRQTLGLTNRNRI